MTEDFILLMPQAAILVTSTEHRAPSEPCTEIVRGQLASSALPQDPERPPSIARQCSSDWRVQSQYPPPSPYQRPQRTITYTIYHIAYSIYTKLNSSVPSFSSAIFIVFLSLCAHFIFEFGFLPALPSLWIGLVCLGLLSVWFVSVMFLFCVCRHNNNNWTGKAKRARKIWRIGGKQIAVSVVVIQFSKSN